MFGSTTALSPSPDSSRLGARPLPRPDCRVSAGSCISSPSSCELLTFNSLLPRVRINIIPQHLRSLCFHTLTHSFAPCHLASPLLSTASTLFAQNAQRWVP